MDRGAWQATVHGVARVGRNLATKERERENGNSPGDLPAPGIKPMSLVSPVLFLPGKFQGQRSLVGYM